MNSRPLLVEDAQVAGAEPAVVGEDFLGLFRVLVVALHHVGAAGLDLAFARVGLGIGDAELDALERGTGGAQVRLERTAARQQRSGLGQAVADGVGEVRLAGGTPRRPAPRPSRRCRRSGCARRRSSSA